MILASSILSRIFERESAQQFPDHISHKADMILNFME